MSFDCSVTPFKANKYIGDLYVKQEFRLHLDKATDDQMDKFLVGWDSYAG